ncbi:ABC transporter permease subunit [Planctomycetota bacterium]
MAVNSLGYRGWSGKVAPAWTRSVVIARTGIRRVWNSVWMKRLLLLSWMPAIWFGLGFFAFEKSIEYPELLNLATEFIQSNHPRMLAVTEMLASGDVETARHDVWAWMLMTFFRHPQSVLMALLVGLIAPPLISQDIRSRAFLLYFSRPMDRFEYVIGKLSTVIGYLVMISAVPALSLYVVGILLSPNLSVVASTWDLPLRIIAATVVMSVPTASFALCLSSMTQETRTAAFAWFAALILGSITFNFVSTMEGINQMANGQNVELVSNSNWSLVSLYHTLGLVQSWAFGFVDFRDIYGSAIAIALLTIASLSVLMRRVAAPMRV